ncbi:MAG: hypothetical protein GTO41_12575 [Burkholderiales bacterium]|nr:hypothetical protein [Burkholderiales bacterium]
MKLFDKLEGLTSAGTIALYWAGFAILASIGILGWQGLEWLKTGQWRTLTLITTLASSGVEWASSPHSWIGIHNLLREVPLTVAVFWLCMIPALLFMLLHNWLVKRQ